MSSEDMLLVVGLGNPGERYRNTRHNIGFMVAERLNERLSGGQAQAKFSGLWSDCISDGRKIGILRPQTYMNKSGNSVNQAINWFKLDLDQIIVIYDDLDLPFGEVRLRRKGSAAGHNGLSSIMQQTGSQELQRLRVGIGRPSHGDTVSYVLNRFSKEEEPELPAVIDHAVDAVLAWIEHDMDEAMGRFNGVNVLARPK